jgi:hypothetical protein
VKRFLAGIGGVLGLSWLLRKRREAVERDTAAEATLPEPDPALDPRAEELRARIEESKAAGDDREQYEAGETPVDAVDDPAARRAAVHRQAEARIEEMAERSAEGGGEESRPA